MLIVKYKFGRYAEHIGADGRAIGLGRDVGSIGSGRYAERFRVSNVGVVGGKIRGSGGVWLRAAFRSSHHWPPVGTSAGLTRLAGLRRMTRPRRARDAILARCIATSRAASSTSSASSGRSTSP